VGYSTRERLDVHDQQHAGRHVDSDADIHSDFYRNADPESSA